MYVPAHFEENRREILLTFVRDNPFGLLITLGADGPDATPVPFLVDEIDDAVVLRCHVARANPIWSKARRDVTSLVVFQGPHAYVTPSWYPSKQQTGKVVPTWNYLMVQARGLLEFHDEPAWLRSHVSQLTAEHEAAQARPWAVEDAPSDFIDKLLGGIVGIELRLSSFSGKWKLSQNRAEADRLGVAQGLRAQDTESSRALAKWMDR
jgi:transcriptional regulator